MITPLLILARRALYRTLRGAAERGWLGAKHHLYDKDGSLYMGRWNIIGEFETDARNGRDILGTRTWGSVVLSAITMGKYRSCRLHWIRRADHDREMHNHPFRYRSLVLNGYYYEEFASSTEDALYAATRDHPLITGQFVHSGRMVTGGPDKFHRISDVPAMGVWTLFFMSENTGEWGFMTPTGYVESKRYFLRKRYKGVK